MKKNEIIVENYTGSKIVLSKIFKTVDFFCKHSNIKIESLSVSFIGDDEMTMMNQKHLSHEGSTDVITFDYSENNDIFSVDGEIIICVDQAKRQALSYKVLLIDELNRLIIHGLLHLTGYDDINSNLRNIMKSKEDEILTKLNKFNLNTSNNSGAKNG